MRKFFTIAILAIISANLFAQKVNKTYWGYTSVVHEEYQVNSSGVKNGYYKEYNNEGEIFKTGSYTNGQKSGLWTTYDMNWSGQISSTMEYSNNKMNGQYKQWCWEKSKRYLCGDYIYKDDEEIKGKQYFSNGQLKYDRDHEKGIYKEWFEDGSAKVETINGKHFTFEWSNSKRNVTSIKFDSLGNNYEYYYDSYGFYLRTITVSQGDVLINIDYNSIANPKVKVKEKNSENNWYYTPEIQLDSTYLRIAFLSYINSPDPNKTKKDMIEYNEQTGDAKIKNSDNSYTIVHYFSTPSVSYSETEYDKEGKILIYRKIDEDFKKKNNNRPLIVKKYNGGVLIEETDNKNKSTITYYLNGQKESEIYVADKDLNRQETIYKEFYENGKIKLKTIKDINGSLLLKTEYYENGIIKSEEITEKGGYRPEKRFEYDKEGGLVKIVNLAANPAYNTEITDKKEIASYLCESYTKKFESKYLIVKVVSSSSGYYNTYEYPKGQNIYQRSKKVIDKYNLDIKYSTDETNTQKLLSELKVFIDKLIEIADSDISGLDLSLKKVKKVEEIKSTILNWK